MTTPPTDRQRHINAIERLDSRIEGYRTLIADCHASQTFHFEWLRNDNAAVAAGSGAGDELQAAPQPPLDSPAYANTIKGSQEPESGRGGRDRGES